MSTLAANDPKLCWDEANKKWVKCKPPSKSTKRGTGPPPPPVAKCCIPNCCIDCDYLLAFKQCLKNLETVQFPVGSGYELRTFAVADFQNLLDPQFGDPYYTACRFWFFRNGATAIAVGGAPNTFNVFSPTFYDQLTQQWTQGTCFNDSVQVTNAAVAMIVGQKEVQCFMLTGANTPECVDIGLCWELRWVDNGNGTYSPVFDTLKLCTQPLVVLNQGALTNCFACGGPFPICRDPEIILREVRQFGAPSGVGNVATGVNGYILPVGSKYDFDFNLTFPGCCTPSYNIFFDNAGIGNLSFVSNPVIDVDIFTVDTAGGVPGIYTLIFRILTADCGTFFVNVPVEVV